MQKENLVIIPMDSGSHDWHLHRENCADVRNYDFNSLNSVWTVSDLADAKATLQHDWTSYEENEGETYDFDLNVKIFPCTHKTERVGA